MLFSDKLKILMEITETSNKVLAKHLIVDPSMISQLRTGARNITKKNSHLQKMAFFFAERCQTPERMDALYDLIHNDELRDDCNITRLNDIILAFLSDNTSDELNSQSVYPARRVRSDIFKANPRKHESELVPNDYSNQGYIFCQNNEEKKECMKRLFEHYMAMKSPDVIYFSSEEIVDWIYDDPVFYNNFRAWCIALIEKGFSIVRIMKPLGNRELFLENILLWFPIFMTGHVHLYYYPHFRDDIFRQTLITVQDGGSYISGSLAQTNTCYYSFFTSDKSISDASIRQTKDFLKVCRPSFYICKTESEIAQAFSHMMSMPGDRITKSYYISPESMPIVDIVEYLNKSDIEEYREVAKTVNRLYSAIDRKTKDDIIIDMCTLATPQEVADGKVKLQLPGFVNRRRISYNVELYVIHLKNILRMLQTNPNYHFYELRPAEFGEYCYDYSPISAVDNYSMLLVNEKNVLHFVQPDIIHTMYEHLYSQSHEHAKYGVGREATIAKIEGLIEEMKAYSLGGSVSG